MLLALTQLLTHTCTHFIVILVLRIHQPTSQKARDRSEELGLSLTWAHPIAVGGNYQGHLGKHFALNVQVHAVRKRKPGMGFLYST